MKVGNIVRLKGSMWSSYERQGEMGLLLSEKDETESARKGQSFSTYGEVAWFSDAEVGLVVLEHLEVINEN